MVAAKQELNHAECVERDLKAWKKIFSLTEKAYGYRINAYKGAQKLVYIPDEIDGKKVAFLYDGAFPADCAVICNKRLWDKLPSTIQENSAWAYLKHPETYPEAYAKVVRTYIAKNKDLVLPIILREDSAEAMERFLRLIVKKTDPDLMEDLLSRSENAPQIRAYLMELSKNPGARSGAYAAKELEKDPFRVTEIKKNWLYQKDEDGLIVITAYKGTETDVMIPERVGKAEVKRVGDYAFSERRSRATPEQKRAVNRIRSIHVPNGIEVLGAGLCQWNMMLTDVYLPESVKEIGEDAFQTYRGPTSVTIHAPAGSYAEQYAKENNIPFETE